MQSNKLALQTFPLHGNCWFKILSFVKTTFLFNLQKHYHANIHWDKLIPLRSKLHILNKQSAISPADYKEPIEGDIEVMIIDIGDIFDVNSLMK